MFRCHWCFWKVDQRAPSPLSVSAQSCYRDLSDCSFFFLFFLLFCVLNEVEYRTLQSVTLWHWSLTPLTNYVFKVLPFRLFRLTSSSTCVPPWQDDEVVLQCVAAIQKENRKFCLSAEGLGNRLCYLEPTSEAKVWLARFRRFVQLIWTMTKRTDHQMRDSLVSPLKEWIRRMMF